MELPFERTWWIEPGKIIGGRFPGTPNQGESYSMLRQLVDAGVALLVNLQEPDEVGGNGLPFPDYRAVVRELAQAQGRSVECLRFPIPDGGIPDTLQMQRILGTLSNAAAAGKLSYVHCWGGHGRTATVAGCWLVQAGLLPDQALARITTSRAHDAHLCSKKSPETPGQIAFIRQWSEKMQRRAAEAPLNAKPMAGTTADRLWGALLGLAVGDALGTTLEFRPPGTFSPLTDMIGGGAFRLQAGEWTDDTSMALCLAESLVERQGFDPVDQLQRYVRWWREGYLSSTGHCFDIGNQTRTSLGEFQKTGQPCCGPTGPRNAGNGSLMRLAPVAMAFWRDPEQAVTHAAASSRTTHGSRECVDACRYFAGLLVGAIGGESKEKLLAPGYAPPPVTWTGEPLASKVAAVAAGSFRNSKEIRGSGYVVDALEAALWAFATTDSFEEAVLRAVNLGDDADTTGAICGQIAGAFYGASAIPYRWREKLALREILEGFCRRISVFAEPQQTQK